MHFPQYRPRRLRASETIRSMVRETTLSPADFIYPLFVKPGPRQARTRSSRCRGSISSRSTCFLPRSTSSRRWACLRSSCSDCRAQGRRRREAYDPDGIVQQAIARSRRTIPSTTSSPTCACASTPTTGTAASSTAGLVVNDVTLELLGKEAVSHAGAGADMVAPSDMMDGRVGAIRGALDAEGFEDVPIMAYSVKFASGFYGPFRDAADSAPKFGDRTQYQMDPANAEEGLREAALDIEEGADLVMVKPALAYLDIIRRVKDDFGFPTAAYNVSGEYSMVKAAAANGWIDEERVVLETLLGFKRAGADLILTYHAKDAARWLAKR